MHFGADAARAGARLAIGWPHLRVALGEVFGDSDVLPDLEAAAAGRPALPAGRI
jgi:hypothetical protein